MEVTGPSLPFDRGQLIHRSTSMVLGFVGAGVISPYCSEILTLYYFTLWHSPLFCNYLLLSFKYNYLNTHFGHTSYPVYLFF